MKNSRLFLLLLCNLVFITSINAQSMMTKTPNKSPHAKVIQTIGLTDVAIDYHRPAARDRDIWKDLVPKNAVWRAGANENTVISFSTDVKIEGKKLSAGSYGLHLLPNENDWTVIFSNNSTSWGSYSYNEKEDALRVNVNSVSNGHFYELLTYDFEGIANGKGICVLKWGDKKIPFNIEADVHEIVIDKMRADLRNKAGWTWIGWNEAANYCLNSGVNLKEGMQWANRSVFMNPNPTNMLTKAKLNAALSESKNEAEKKSVMLSSLEKDLNNNNCTWKEWDAAAKIALQNEDMDKALAWTNKSIGMSPNMSSLMTKVEILEKSGEGKAAMKFKKDALSKGTNAELNAYGYKLLFGGKALEAVEIFKANTEKHPNDPNVWDSLGEAYVNTGQKEKAIKALKKSLSLNPPANVRSNSMKLLGKLGVQSEEIHP